MVKNKFQLCLGASPEWGTSIIDLLTIMKKVGFDGFFVDWNEELDVKAIKNRAHSLGLKFQSIHAPYYRSADMWEENENTALAVKELLDCLEDCYTNNVPIMVCHAVIGFDLHSPNEAGVKNFKLIVDKAKEYGIKIAFENTEGEEYLDYLMEAFESCENVGFCWDTGHEMCYNRHKDMLSLYGDRLICTHINDNLGITDPNNIFWTDDLHLLPFDGIADWQNIASRLDNYNYTGEMTLELNKQSKPDRHENDKYDAMSTEEYVKEIFNRAQRVAALRK